MSRDSNHDRDKNQNHKIRDLGSIQAAVFVEEKPNSLLGEVGSWNFAMREAFDLLEVVVSHVELLLREPLLVFDVNIVDGLEHLVLDSSSAVAVASASRSEKGLKGLFELLHRSASNSVRVLGHGEVQGIVEQLRVLSVFVVVQSKLGVVILGFFESVKT